MPLYEYKCLKCGRHTEKIEPVAGPHLKKCPHCAGKLESVITAPAIKFKGSGWYINDYASKSNTGDSQKADTPAADSKEAKETTAKDAGSKDSGSKDSNSKDAGRKESAKESGAKDSKERKTAKK
ncbi:MAG TPA: zinc ribbon domain-containing protein [Candidatus Dormibacteraeota bacterium]|nr:zinc ribbon domain-containing protein [Candidatus Dormibacteraeota bacterium]